MKFFKLLNQRMSFWVVLLVLAMGYLLFNPKMPTDTNKAKVPMVVVAAVRNADVPVYVNAIGNVTPTYNITVKTLINGTLISVLYKEGQLVKAGELLAEIDSRPYEAQLVQYEGQLMRDQALLANARIDLVRYQKLWKQNAVSQQTYATQEALVKQYEGTVQTDEGLIQSTKVNLIYCKITSPVDGRIGLRLVDPGNFVQTSDTNGIAVVNTLNPITVIFTIPEDSIPQVAKKLYDATPLTVQAYDRTQTHLLATGKMLAIDNQIDPTTGTVKLRAQFDNHENTLFPSQFVNIKLRVDTLQQATVIPAAAVMNSPKGAFVYTLNKNKTVSATPIVTGVYFGDNVTVKTGLQPDDQVVTEGADKLADGMKVTLPDPDSRKGGINPMRFLRRVFT